MSTPAVPEYRVAWITFRHPDGSMKYTTVASDHHDDNWVANGKLLEGYSDVELIPAVEEALKAEREYLINHLKPFSQQAWTRYYQTDSSIFAGAATAYDHVIRMLKESL